MADGRAELHMKRAPIITRRSVFATVIGLAVFCVVGLVISSWYRATAPRPAIAVMDEKLRDFAGADPAYDIVFLGSSQTFRHIDPAVIDQGLRQCGLEFRTYNFGIPALRQPELDYVASEILKRDDKPRLLVLQNAIRAETVYSNMMSPRGRYFRGGPHVGAALEDVQCYTGRRRGQARSLLNNVRVILAEQFGLGRMAETWVSDPDPLLATYDQGFRRNAGFWPVNEDMSGHVIDRITNSPMTDAILADGLAQRGFAPAGDTVACRARQLTSTLDAFRSAGVDVAYYVSPAPMDVVQDRAITDAVAALNPDLPILDFNTPPATETFFREDLWFDNAHLTGKGAAQLSAAIANRLCQVLDE